MPRRVLSGTVVSDKTDKTIVVSVERAFKHPLYGKTVRKSKRYSAHDETNQGKVGETVQIRECRPHSKTKRFELLTGSEAAAE